MLVVQRMYGTFLIAFYERVILGGQEVITMRKQLVTSVTLIDRSLKAGLGCWRDGQRFSLGGSLYSV